MNQLTYHLTGKASDLEIELFIDGNPLLDMLDDAYRTLMQEPWAEKDETMVIAKELKKSSQQSGSYPFLVGIQCKMAEDVLLSAIEVNHTETEVHWIMNPPGANMYVDQFKPIEFTFQKAQYKATILQLMDEKMMRRPIA